MTVLMVQERFVDLVRAGTKDRTLRAPRKRPIRLGDALSLRRWTGRPYMSKQEIIKDTVCVEVAVVFMGPAGDGLHLRIDGVDIYERSAVDAFAGRDGFRSAIDMRAWFQSTHGLPWMGTMIRWRS